MSADQRLWDTFEQVAALPLDRQEAALQEICGDDQELLSEVAGMLEADRQSSNFLDQPIVGNHSIDEMPTRTDSPPQKFGGRLEAGSRVGPYRIIRLLDEGGMGAVYLAARADHSFNRRVVLKLVRAGMETSQILDRLKAERRILAGLDHPYISRLYDGGSTDDGRPYFVLEYIEGEAIDAFCRKNELSVDERLALFAKVCEVVQFAHQNLVIHRDLKPRNILVTSDGTPKLLDFGIAKLINPDIAGGNLDPTDPILRIATPNYASPEQLRGDLVSTSSDVYSLGVLLYKLLTGHLPYSFSGLTLAEIESQLAQSTPIPPSVAITRPVDTADSPRDIEIEDRPPHPKLESDLDAIVLKALRTVPRQRYGSAEKMAEDIDRYRQGLPVSAHSGNWRYRTGKFLRRHRGGVLTTAAMGLVWIGFAVAFFLQARRVADERDLANLERDRKAQVLSLFLELVESSSPYAEPGKELTVREAVERGLDVLGASLDDQPDVRAELLHAVGNILYELGANETAREHLTESIQLQKNRVGNMHPSLAATTCALAATYKELGEFERAEQIAREALDLARQGARDLSPRQAAGTLAKPINELVSILCYQSEYDAAESVAREALELTSQLPDSGYPRIKALEQLARIRDALGDYNEAIRLNREAISLRRSRLGEMHPAQLGVLNNLGSSLRRSGELEAAVQVYGEALEIYRHNFGARKTSRVLPALLNNLATVCLKQGDLDRADELFSEAQGVVLETMGESHWQNFHFAARRASIKIKRGDASAEPELRFLIERWLPTLGDNWRLDEARGLLGTSLSLQLRCEEAEPLLVGSFDKLIALQSANVRQEALERLRRHFERCGTPQDLKPYADRLNEMTG